MKIGGIVDSEEVWQMIHQDIDQLKIRAEKWETEFNMASVSF